jgi:TorA maturation chaperone TorD
MTQSVAFRTYVAAEDHGRANFYALISRLFAAPPDAALLSAIASSPPLPTEDDGAPLAMAWSKLIAASGVVDETSTREEYESLFGGVGKAQVNLHGSHHLTGFMMEKPLAALRSDLTTLGFARLESQTLTEDHLASLCEIMRILIIGGDGIAPLLISEQRRFFEAHLSSWFERCFAAISDSSLANYYKVGAQFGNEFLRIERESFSVDS